MSDNAQKKTANVLIVDDVVINLEILAEIIKSNGSFFIFFSYGKLHPENLFFQILII